MNLIFSLIILFLFSCSHLNDSTSQLKIAPLLPGHTRGQHDSLSKKIMIATQGIKATEAGLKMIELGGNAFDAAAAITFTISVERPQSTGLGGGGFMLLDGPDFKEPKTLDFREQAPLKSFSNMYLDATGNPIAEAPSLDGIFSSAVPGTVKGVIEMHKKYGKLKLAAVIQPAIQLARDGFKVYPELAFAIEQRKNILAKFEASRSLFFNAQGLPLKENDLLIQSDLAKTLSAIAQKGSDGFYKGWVADAIVKEFKRQKGLITREDLQNYRVKWRKPVVGKYRDYQIYSMGPPSSGGTHVIQILNLVEPLNLKQYGPQSVETIHQTATAMQLAFVDRARYMGDSDFVKVPLAGLLSQAYAHELRKKMGSQAIKVVDTDLPNAFAYESDETTHFTVMDAEGNVVSSTQTLNYFLGSGVIIPGTGILMNDEMDDFSVKPGHSNVFGAIGSQQNSIEANKRPLSTMSPTIVRKNNKPILALGTPSGTRILTCVAQVILNYLEHGLNLYDAVAATRFHHQWSPDEIRIDESGFSQMVVKGLEAKGHKVQKNNLNCRVQAVALENDMLHGVSDIRGEGFAKGL